MLRIISILVIMSIPNISFGVDCIKLNEQSCVESKECLLKQNADNKYICTKAVTGCEIGFIQFGDGSEKSCTKKSGCKFIPDNCYCPPGPHGLITCPCGGGPPAMCIKQTENTRINGVRVDFQRYSRSDIEDKCSSCQHWDARKVQN